MTHIFWPFTDEAFNSENNQSNELQLKTDGNLTVGRKRFKIQKCIF